jgi:hypothetical protein
MEARLISRVNATTLLLILVAAGPLAAQIRSPNFVVYAAEPAMARKVAAEAERFRKELAMLWLGRELPNWDQPCPIQVRIEMHAGGETSFAFVRDQAGRSRPIDWDMTIFGPPERILDSVLPHEVTHTIFATHYGRPLPRWADEGACTMVEHSSERQKNHSMLIDFLSNGRGIPFNHMFVMKQYPSDILPLYAQGHSVARFLIMQNGHRHFVNFVGRGMELEVPGRETGAWSAVCKDFYGYKDLSDLQVRWNQWVRDKCPDLSRQVAGSEIAADNAAVKQPASGAEAVDARIAIVPVSAPDATRESWYVQQSRAGRMMTGNNKLDLQAARGDSSTANYLPGSTGVVNDPGNTGRSDRSAITPQTIWR